MVVISDRTFAKGEAIQLDGHFFINCKAEECILIFGGGDYGWERTHFAKSRLIYFGAAQRTLNLLQNLGLKIQPIEAPVTPPDKVN